MFFMLLFENYKDASYFSLEIIYDYMYNIPSQKKVNLRQPDKTSMPIGVLCLVIRKPLATPKLWFR